MDDAVLQRAIAQVPAGSWAVGVSGGADSVALLSLLRDREDLQLVAVHLDHETRGQASTDDAHFVAERATMWRLPAVIARRSEIEPRLVDLPTNPSAMYRACRLELFRQVVADRALAGVILAHHADDQAETVLHRLIRGAPATALAGMSCDTTLGGLRILRPLLGVRRETLRRVLIDRGQPHREDASNASDDYLRNRLRKLIADEPALVDRLLDLSTSCASLRDWVTEHAPILETHFRIGQLCSIPALLAREGAKRWLMALGAPPDDLSTAVLDRLILLCSDASTPARVQFPGNITVRRRRGVVERVLIDTIPGHEQ